MSEIKELIERLCPDGVEYKKLGELEIMQLIQLGRGNVISKKDIRDYPGEYPVYSSSSVGDGEIGRYGKYMFDDERISWSIDGGGKFFYRNNIKYSITNVSGWLKVLAPQTINTKYLYYSLMNEWSHKIYDYIHKAHPSVIREEYEIPVPPIEVQSKIVEILDNLTELEAELETELETELEARRKQYEYYRNQLLTFDKDKGARFDVKWMTLGEICSILDSMRKPVTKNNRSAGKYPYYGASGIVDYVADYIFDGDYLLVSEDGANLEMRTMPIAFSISGKNWVNNHAHILKFESIITQRYVQYYIEHMDISTYLSKGSMPKLTQGQLKSIQLPVPPLEEQKRIVSNLDRFEALTTDLQSGLSAEIEARRKQYEYYREQLLTFKRKTA